jgi:membrane dipeptidase
MKIVDLHCDTISYLSRTGSSLRKNEAQFDIQRAQAAHIAVQFFALFNMPTDRNTSLRLTLIQVEKFMSEIENNSSQAYHLLDSADLLVSDNSNKLACILHLEGAECLGADLEILNLFYRLGLRSLGLTWNNRNLLADGVSEGELAGGLSCKGKELVEEMSHLGIMLDLAHISEKSYHDALEYYPKPVMVTHANAWAICPHRRNMNDSQLHALAQHGGVIGVTQVADFVKEGHATVEDMLDHIAYIANLIGVEHVALGSDFDGADNMVIPQVGDYADLPSLLAGRGFTGVEIEMILSENALKIIRQII